MVRRDIAAVKAAMPQLLHDVVQRAMHLHGALGFSNESVREDDGRGRRPGTVGGAAAALASVSTASPGSTVD